MIDSIACTLCLTHNCNLRCAYCYAGRKYAQSMSREIARQAMDIVLEEARRTESSVDLSFFGGEPLLEWELLQWCDAYMRANGKGLAAPPRYGLTTNGTLLTPDKLEWLSERDYLIGLSIDGSPAMHNASRRFANGQGSHAAVLPALDWLAAHPGTRSQAICVVTPGNVRLLSEGVAWLSARYPGIIGLNIDYWSDWSDSQFEILAGQCRKTAALVLGSYRAGRPIRLENLEDKIDGLIRSDETDCNRCRLGEKEIAVSVSGNFFPCSRLVAHGDDPELFFGNVREGINRALQNLLIATRGNATPACKLCTLRARCINACGCTNHAASGYINQVSPFLCCSEKLLIRTADQLAETLYAERNPAFMQRFYGGCGNAPAAP